jgi:hypothetical protein
MKYTVPLIETSIRKLSQPASTIAALMLVWFGITPPGHAVAPPPSGGYPGGNTAAGRNALLSLTTGAYNTGVGVFSLLTITDGNFCTGIGAGTLLTNTADQNTATGAGALFSNTEGEGNTASGAFALFNNTDHSFNTANGFEALFTNKTGQNNTATGAQALFSNDGDPTNNEASNNSAFGNYALYSNTIGYGNSAFGWGAMPSNNSGSFNTATGFQALGQAVDARNGAVATGNYNTAVGERALGGLTTGSYNATLGAEAGSEVNTASNVVCIGAGVPGISSIVGEVDDSCYIGNIYNGTIDVTTALPVFVDRDGKLGTQGFDGNKIAVSGLQDAHSQGIPDEFLKEHKKTRQLEMALAQQRNDFDATIAELKKKIDSLLAHSKEQDTKIHMVSVQVELKGLTANRVLDNR